MGRNILLITTDQMRFDALGCNGGTVARTPVIDRLAAAGINYSRAHNQHVVCMPARATIMTGQHVSTHGVKMNGMCLPEDTPTIAHVLKEHGYHTALLGKAHFEPWLGDPQQFFENRMAAEGNTGPHRGFDHMELANHFFEGHSHYDQWMRKHHPESMSGFYTMVGAQGGQNYAGGGATGAVQVWDNPVARELYHTDWVADRTIDWLDTRSDTDDWFCWMSFPDPHHPWDPPASERRRVDWRDVPLPSLYSEPSEALESSLRSKGAHWLGYYDGTLWSNLESPRGFVPKDLSADQIREINAMNHIENELIDEACGRVIDWLAERGWDEDTDIFFTTDHGELQGDFGLLFKGPYHIDALMRLPFIWRPAPSANIKPDAVTEPVGHLDLAATFCDIAACSAPAWIEGEVLPVSADAVTARQGVLTEWDSVHGPVELHLRSLYHRDGYLLTAYEPSSVYQGTEGELYDLNDDPEQRLNRWGDPAYADRQADLTALLYEMLPTPREPPLLRLAPV